MKRGISYARRNLGMPDTDEEARKARAARLRAEIERLKSRGEPAKDNGEEPPPPKNPREFIHEKMRQENREG